MTRQMSSEMAMNVLMEANGLAPAYEYGCILTHDLASCAAGAGQFISVFGHVFDKSDEHSVRLAHQESEQVFAIQCVLGEYLSIVRLPRALPTYPIPAGEKLYIV